MREYSQRNQAMVQAVVERGELQYKVAEAHGISAQRLGQILKRYKRKTEVKIVPEAESHDIHASPTSRDSHGSL